MTKVYSERKGDRNVLCATGHATGSVEVCAAVSAILYALIGFLHNTTDKEIYYEEAKGGPKQAARFVVDCEGGPEVRAAFDMANIGLLQIQELNPEFIDVECVEL